MKLNLGIHIAMHSVLSLKPGVTSRASESARQAEAKGSRQEATGTKLMGLLHLTTSVRPKTALFPPFFLLRPPDTQNAAAACSPSVA